jgi:uncharacterized protein YceH (UPF0502 family)
VLLLRGPQTPGELRGRTDRLHSFGELSDVLSGLQKLMDREPPLAAILPRQPGTKESRYAHLLSGPVESIALTTPEAPAQHNSSATNQRIDDERIERLEAEVNELRRQMDELRQKIETLFT